MLIKWIEYNEIYLGGLVDVEQKQNALLGVYKSECYLIGLNAYTSTVFGRTIYIYMCLMGIRQN